MIDERPPDSPPADWPKTTVGRLGMVVGGGTPSRDVSSNWGGDIPWVTPGELTGLESKYLDGTAECISESGLAGSGAVVLPKDSLLITTRATIGSAALAAVPTATNQGFKSVIFEAESSPDFYYHLIPHIKNELVRRASGTTFLEISGSEFASVEVPAPRLREQRRIAAILDTLDEAIRQTDAIIAKLKLIRQGLVRDLLTRGIDESGELRPHPRDAPQLYRETSLGPIPRSWEALRVDEVSDTFSGGTPSRAVTGFYVGWVPWVKSAEVNKTIIEETEEHITERALAGSSAKWVPPKTALMAMYGATAGVVSWLAVRATTNQAVLALPPRSEQTNPRWLYWALRFGVPRILSTVQGSGQPNLSKSTIDAALLACPDPSEQEAIVVRLDALERRWEAETASCDALREMKDGLADDLLTGRVRVPVPEEAAT